MKENIKQIINIKLWMFSGIVNYWNKRTWDVKLQRQAWGNEAKCAILVFVSTISHVTYSSSQISLLVFPFAEGKQLMLPGPDDITKGISPKKKKNSPQNFACLEYSVVLASILIAH